MRPGVLATGGEPVSDIPLYKVPMTLKRGMQWATRCAGCDKELRMGPGSKAAMLRLLDAVGRKCNECRTEEFGRGDSK
jgi:hypothetical protein